MRIRIHTNINAYLSTKKSYLLFQCCLVFMFGRLVHEIGYVKWNTIEDEQVASLLSLHITILFTYLLNLENFNASS